MSSESQEKISLPHHKQQELCTTRLPYRQGRKLTAVKCYTINRESNHLFIFGVPSLKLRQETKSLLSRFGKLIQFHISTDHPSEPFTETYHAVYERIQSARLAKRMVDTKNFYGSSLHICYAPEMETMEETKQKLLQRQRDVLYRLKNLQKDTEELKSDEKFNLDKTHDDNSVSKLNMGEINTISVGKQIREVVFNKNKRKHKETNAVIEKKFKPCFDTCKPSIINARNANNNTKDAGNSSNNTEIEIIDFTSVEKETISNINEALNYNKFGNEVIRNIPQRPVNKITFNLVNKNKLL